MISSPFERVLLPVDRSDNSRRAIKFAGAVLSEVEGSGITILYVMAGGYLSEHMKNIDFRAELIKGTEVFKKIRAKHIEENITPFLNDYESILKTAGVKGEIVKRIEEGDPGNKIIEIALKEGFQTVILARRGMSELKSLIIGSVSNKVIHGLLNQNIYLVGQKISEQNPVSRILVPVDGSQYSMKAVEHAVCLAKTVKGIENITVLRVINVSLYLERVRQGIDPEAEAEEILNKAKRRFCEEGIPEQLISTKSRAGFPVDEILKEIEEGGYSLIIMGRKGRTAMKDLVLGGVSSSVINKCLEPTVAIVNQ
ncbi:universal stress protein [Thermodesulfovibrio sp. 3907-1M]|uniref:Universal stress protein n=1 Tax=Thermodesulfovibrio autotrophicus TaxID=3118333 RepID=A0AAU8GYI9_9BACT